MLLSLTACTVDGSVIDDLPCECAPGFVCDVVTNRCVLDDGRPRDGGTDAGTTDAPPPVDAAPTDAPPGDVPSMDAGTDARTDVGPMDAGTDVGPGLPCLAGPSEDFSAPILSSAWATVTDGDAEIQLDRGELVTIVPPGPGSIYSFIIGRTRQDLSDCAVSVELVTPTTGPVGVSFLSARVNSDADFGFSVIDGVIRGAYDTVATAEFVAWTAPYDPDAHRHLAIGGDGGELVWQVSRDGLTWTEVARAPSPFDTTALEYIIGVGSRRVNGATLSARFDNFNQMP